MVSKGMGAETTEAEKKDPKSSKGHGRHSRLCRGDLLLLNLECSFA